MQANKEIVDFEQMPISVQPAYGVPRAEEPKTLAITSICVGVLAVVIGIVVVIKKKLKRKKENKDVEK